MLPNTGSSFIDRTCWSKKRPEGGDVNRTQERLLAATKRARRLMDPTVGNFLREHNVSADELGELGSAVSVVLVSEAGETRG